MIHSTNKFWEFQDWIFLFRVFHLSLGYNDLCEPSVRTNIGKNVQRFGDWPLNRRFFTVISAHVYVHIT